MRHDKDWLRSLLEKPGYAIGHAAVYPHNPCAPCKPQDTKPEPPIRDESVGSAQGKAAHPASYVVRFVSYRTRLLEEDNLIPKYFCDCLRYSGIIPGDSPDICHIETTQVKVRGKENEFTEINIERYETS